MKRLISMVLLLAAYILFSSHELFLKTDSYFISPKTSSELYLYNGTFDKSENNITRDRIQDSRIIGPDFEKFMKEKDYYDKEKSTYLKFKAGSAGTYVAGVLTLPKMIEMDAKAFNDYLEHEGLEDTILKRKQDGSFTHGAREKYSKHVKLLLQVGDKKTEEFKAEFGFPVEFIPVNNPYEASAGDTISFKLLSNGKPLPNHIVHYSTSMPEKDAHENESSTRTDENGVMTMTPTQSGNWYVATIHMVKSQEKGVDYESNWATLTFGVK
ncbi:DUF4198 domain-containing protein [Croceitalea rosinachiae]|uniref:DUF4198 domain-containing protein n=1 Tax=Croceitalea rosinachiae TaxID=3075596 RepID=A0ABU3A9U8_9FLAO|nr:DUF4198 domain-containing protein [Croceitalea sp. F388]MDT0606953.1 DUF4198 domain-containing protein [Croceitalea sp. F388]